MSKTKKIFLIFIITFLLVNIFNEVLAIVNPDNYDPGSITEEDTSLAFAKTGIILGAVRNISAIVAVIALMMIGFKYIIGSVEEKSNYKAAMIPYIIGCVMAVAGITIVSFIYNAIH